jgi:hypothetical protein
MCDVTFADVKSLSFTVNEEALAGDARLDVPNSKHRLTISSRQPDLKNSFIVFGNSVP